eukprot:COSAG01_NODE_9244_length_2507_cov_2.899502_2_plen_138_part_00
MYNFRGSINIFTDMDRKGDSFGYECCKEWSDDTQTSCTDPVGADPSICVPELQFNASIYGARSVAMEAIQVDAYRLRNLTDVLVGSVNGLAIRCVLRCRSTRQRVWYAQVPQRSGAADHGVLQPGRRGRGHGRGWVG